MSALECVLSTRPCYTINLVAFLAADALPHLTVHPYMHVQLLTV